MKSRRNTSTIIFEKLGRLRNRFLLDVLIELPADCFLIFFLFTHLLFVNEIVLLYLLIRTNADCVQSVKYCKDENLKVTSSFVEDFFALHLEREHELPSHVQTSNLQCIETRPNGSIFYARNNDLIVSTFLPPELRSMTGR